MQKKKNTVFMKMISFCLAILLLPVTSFSAENPAYKLFDSYENVNGFENGALDDLLSVQNATDGSTVSFTEDPHSGGNHGQTIQLRGTKGGGYSYVMPYYGGSVKANPLKIGFDFYADAENVSGEDIGITLVIEGVYAKALALSDGKVYHNDKQLEELSYIDKTWYNIELQMDWNARYVQIRMKKADETDWKKVIITDTSCFSSLTNDSELYQIRIGYRKLPSSGSADFYIDNYYHKRDIQIKPPKYTYFDGFSQVCDFDDANFDIKDYVFPVNETGNSYASIDNFPQGGTNRALHLHHGGDNSDGMVYFMPYYKASGAAHPLFMSFDFYAADSLELFVRLVLTNGQPLIFTFKNGTVNYGLKGSRTPATAVNGEKVTYSEDAWYSVRIGVNWDTNHINMLIKKTDEEVWTEIDMQNMEELQAYSAENDSLSQIRIGYYVNPGKPSDVYIDNYMHRIGGPGATEITGVYAGKPHAFVEGKQTQIGNSTEIVPYYNNDVLMVPADFFANSIGAKFSSDGSKVNISKEAKTVSVDVNTNKITADEEEKYLTASVQIKDNTVFLPLCDLCENFGYDLFTDSSGLAFYTCGREPLSWESDKKEILELTESFIYDDVSGEEIVQMIKMQNTARGDNHPRLLMTEERFAEIRAEMAKPQNERDPAITKIYTKVKAAADSYLTLIPPEYKLNGVRLIDTAGEYESRIMCLAMMYNLVKDANVALANKYAEAARSTMLAAASFSDWNPYHFLDVSIMSTGLAFGYDWLYDWMVKKGHTDELEIIRQAIVEKAFVPVMNDYNGVSYHTSKYTNNGSARSYLWNAEKNVNNWRFVVSGGLGISALATADELDGESLLMAETVLSRSLTDIRPAISLFAPNGAYSEGLGYWGFANQYYQYELYSLKTATGTDFGYSDAPGLRKTAAFLLATTGAVSNFNYHDSGRTTASVPAQIMAWAKHFDNPSDAQFRRKLILESQCSVQDFLYYDMSFAASQESEPENDALFKEIGVFTTRSGFETDDIWVGFHADDPIPGSSHAHNDSGSFVLDASGQNFFLDLGPDDYNLEKYSGGIYRTRAEGHNTFVINPKAEKYSDGTVNFYDQCYGAEATIDQCIMKERGAFAISNLSDVYTADVISAWRGVKLDDDRSTVTVQDEIVMREPSDYYWFAHTEAEIDIDENNPKKAVLTLNGTKLYAQIVTENETDDVCFSVMDAVPFETSPKVEGQNPNEGIKKLTIHLENCESVNMAVVFSEYNNESNLSYSFTPLEEWSIPDGEIPKNDIQATMPMLNGTVVSTDITGKNPIGKTAVLIVALYDGDNFKTALCEKITVSKKEEELYIDLKDVKESYTHIKAYVWDEQCSPIQK